MKRFSRCLVLFALLLFLTPAARPAEGGPDTPYFPLKVGTTWHYKVGQNRFSLKVAKHEKVGKVDAARVELIINGKTTSFEHVGVTADAVLRYSFEGKQADPPITVLKLPPRKGASWKVESKVDGHLMKGTFTIGEEENVKVPADTYKKTITVTGKDMEVNGVKLNVTYYFAEKVGMVKQVLEMANQKVIIELEKYEPGK
jgi:hypothetical protein